jgi:hypothetical protein
MSVDLYTLKKRAVMVLFEDGKREAAYFLQLAVEHAFSQDSQRMVDSAIRHAANEWEREKDLPDLVVQIGMDGLPRPGSAIFRWDFCRRGYCFEHELPPPLGYLGEKEILGFPFRKSREYSSFSSGQDPRSTHHLDESSAGMYGGFRRSAAFDSARQSRQPGGRYRRSRDSQTTPRRPARVDPPPRLSKILTLIRFIETKGMHASQADLQFLGCLRDKACQLGHSF